MLKRFYAGLSVVFCRRQCFEMSQIEPVSNFGIAADIFMALPAKKRADVLNGI
jgi:hypothetical protein